MGAEQSSSDDRGDRLRRSTRNSEYRNSEPRHNRGTMDSAHVQRILDAQRTLYEKRCREIVNSHMAQAEPTSAPSLERNRAPYNYRQEDLQNARERTYRSNNIYPNLYNNEPTTSMGGPNPSPNVSFAFAGQGKPTPSDFVFVNNNGTVKNSPSAPPRDRSVSSSRNRNTSVEDDNPKCPTCRGAFGLYIYNCAIGHSSCKSCKLRNVPCGICNQLITDMRNITLESYVAERKVPCSNTEDGCRLMIKLADMESHLKECPFNEMACPLNAVLHKNCPWRGKINQMSAHFDHMHSDHRAEEGTELYLPNICTENNFVYLVVKGNFNFLLNLWVSEKERMIYMTAQLIGTKISAQKWIYDIEIYNKREPRRKYQFIDVCNSSSEPVNEIFKESKCAALPLPYAMNFVNEGVICYKFNIENTFKGRNNFQRQRGRGGRRP